MKPMYVLSIPLIVVLLTGCAEFPTSYSRIELDKARLLDFIYEPAEAAPGDTVLLKAIFTGKVISADELTWRMSQKVIINQYGTATAVDTVPIEMVYQACTFSDRTSCIAFTFVIPENIIAESPLIPDNWVEVIPEYYREYIPSALRSMSKNDLLAMVDNLSAPGNLASVPVDDGIRTLLPLMLQCFTAQMRIYCTIENDHTILSRYNVRYNSRLASIPQLHIPVNRNPRIDSVGVYIVHKAQLSTFDPTAGKYSFDYLPVRDTGLTTITIDENSTYFMTSFTGDVDTTLSIDAAMGNGTPLPEQHVLQWYMEFDEQEIEKVSPPDLMNISGTQPVAGQYLSPLYPSKNSAITNCTVWLEVYDQFLNEYYRPQGSTLKEMRLGFTYTDAYLKCVKKK